MNTQTKILITPTEPDYELLSSGQNYKLERYGKFVIARPDGQAMWPADLNDGEWLQADATFKKSSGTGGQDEGVGDRGEWQIRNASELNNSSEWQIKYGGLNLQIKLSPFKHTGLFPEQIINWQWMEKIVKNAVDAGKKPKILNLFGYTGGATLICAKSGGEVTHVDASKSAITWANKNAELSGLADKPIRWILEDAASFVKRELRRGNKYDAIIMDPPAFGRGAKGELWKIEENFLPFFDDCLKLLSDQPIFVVLNGYSAGYSSITYARNLEPLIERFGGEIEHGELCIEEGNSQKKLLPCGIVARWSGNK
jgi:23S rRNA (cytosine1962-C5)-methyltransferase